MDHLVFNFSKLNPVKSYLGTNKGGWVYASERTKRARVELPSFMIMKDPISEKQFAPEILGKKE